MLSLLPFPVCQFTDANGKPLNAGTVSTYVSSTLVLKNTWADPSGEVLNQNPIALDSAGRATIYGTGSYRFIVKNRLGVVQYDSDTSSYLDGSAVSDAMLPVTSAATLATARSLLGVDSAIATAVGAVSLLPGPTGPASTVAGPTGPTGASGASATDYVPALTGTNPGFFRFPNVNGVGLANCFIQFGAGATDSGGNATVSFAQPYPNACLSVVVSCTSASWWASVTGQNNSSFSVNTSSPLHGGTWSGGPVGFQFLSIGF